MNRMQAIPLAILTSFLITLPCAAANAPNDAALQVAERHNRYELSVPASRLIMTLPKGNFAQNKNVRSDTAHSPRHFYFEDKKRGIVVAGWFEPASSYSNFGKLWNDEKESWRSTNRPMPADESLFHSGDWEAVAYDLPLPEQKASSSNIRASWVQAGTWIDLHLSLTSKNENHKSREKLAALLKSIQVKQRP